MNHKAKLLIIDDDHILVRAMVLGFSAFGYEVLTAQDGLQGLAMFEKETPDLVILDMLMPKMDGLKTSRLLREKWHGPLIILSACAQPTDRMAGLQQGADEYIVKPFVLKKLTTRVESLLQGSQAQYLCSQN